VESYTLRRRPPRGPQPASMRAYNNTYIAHTARSSCHDVLPLSLSNQLFCTVTIADHRTAKLHVGLCTVPSYVALLYTYMVTVQNSAEIQLKMLGGEGSMGPGSQDTGPSPKAGSQPQAAELVQQAGSAGQTQPARLGSLAHKESYIHISLRMNSSRRLRSQESARIRMREKSVI
jgi:hypothetical protein